MITSSQERFTCSMYPEPAKISDDGLNFAYNRTAHLVKFDENHDVFKYGFSKGDHVEAMAMLILESTYRWNHLGGKERHAEIFQSN